MPDTKTSDESVAGTLDGSELVRIVKSGAMAKTTTQDIADLAPVASFALSGATDVDVTGAADGSLLAYDAGVSEWMVLVRGAPGSSLKATSTDIEWAYSNQQEAVAVVSTSPLPGSPTYSNGTGGTGATLTATVNGALVVDGVTMTTNNVRILVAGQADAKQNGAFKVTQFGDGSHPYIIERAEDWNGDTVAAGGVRLGDTFVAYQGSNNIGLWAFSSNSSVGAVVFGTSLLGFTKVASVVSVTGFISGTLTSPADNDILVYDTGTFVNKKQDYKIAFSAPQTTAFTASQVVGHHKVAAAITIPANFGSYLGLASQAGGSANAAASTVFSVEQAVAATPNTFSQIGTITFASGTVTATFATSSGTAKNLAAGDVLRIVAPSSPDSTFAGFYATLIASRQ